MLLADALLLCCSISCFWRSTCLPQYTASNQTLPFGLWKACFSSLFRLLLALKATGLISGTCADKPPASTSPGIPWDVSRIAKRCSFHLHIEPLKWGATCYDSLQATNIWENSDRHLGKVPKTSCTCHFSCEFLSCHPPPLTQVDGGMLDIDIFHMNKCLRVYRYVFI